MIDRSISSLRTLRPETDFDKSIFWFRDDLHQPYAISPMGMTTLQLHHAWGYHVAAEETKLPPSKGGHVKTYKGRVYIGFALMVGGMFWLFWVKPIWVYLSKRRSNAS